MPGKSICCSLITAGRTSTLDFKCGGALGAFYTSQTLRRVLMQVYSHKAHLRKYLPALNLLTQKRDALLTVLILVME